MKNINNLQLRSARQVLNLGVRDIAALLKTNKSSISNAELGKTRDFFFKNSAPLIDFFIQKNIIFPNEYIIRLQEDSVQDMYNKNEQLNITRFQLKGARTLLNISQYHLSRAININQNVISRAEKKDNLELINPSDKKVIYKIKEFFLTQGIEFPDLFSVFFKKIMYR